MWRYLFQEHILYRGEDYYHRSLVENVKIEEGQITGVVRGTSDYFVEIIREDEEIIDLSCTCPYADSGNSCKHMAAMLFYVESNINHGTTKSQEESVKELVEEVNTEVLKDFVIDLFLEDDRLFQRFKNTVKKVFSPADLFRYKNQINHIFWEYAGYDDFIDYNNAYDFAADLVDLINHDFQKMVDLKEWSGAFEGTEYLLKKLGNQPIDDSGGDTWIIIRACIQIWEQILEQCEMNLKRKIYHFLLEMIDGEHIEYSDYFSMDIEQFIFDQFKEEEFQRNKLKRLDDQIKVQKQKRHFAINNYPLSKLCLRKVKILEELQTDPKEIDHYCMEHIYLDEIRKYYIDLCIRRKDYDQAITLLKEGKKQPSVNQSDLIFYSTTLKDLYKQLKMKEAYRKELWKLLVKYDKGNLDLFREVKSLYSKEDWLEKREVIFHELADCVNIAGLYKEEGLYDRLIDVVMESYELSMVGEYEDVLKDLYPEKLLEKYESTVREMARLALGRAHYRKLVFILRKMQKYPGGQARVAEIISDWRVQYANRPAMMDELNKL